jgi:hypothetical protein
VRNCGYDNLPEPRGRQRSGRFHDPHETAGIVFEDPVSALFGVRNLEHLSPGQFAKIIGTLDPG